MRIRTHFLGLLCGTALLPAALAPQAAKDGRTRINQLQFIGTHNSYHAGLALSEMKVMQARSWRTAQALDYRHPPLAEQLSAGIRQIELDVFADPEGGRFAHPNVIARVAAAGLPPDPDFDPEHEMSLPGFKVMHLQDVDQRSRCHLFVRCLQEVRGWSKGHRTHLPIFILIECKTPRVPDASGATRARPMTPELFDALDGEIRSVFRAAEIIVPDQVRGNHINLLEAIQEGGWPTLAQARGKVLFLLDNRELASIYTQEHEGLRGRILFPNVVPDTPNSAFTEMNEGSREAIEALVKQGYLVRTRADEDTLQARNNDTRRRDEAMASGAQIISTDYPASEPARWSSYSVSFPGNRMVRCDPVNLTTGCRDEVLEASR